MTAGIGVPPPLTRRLAWLGAMAVMVVWPCSACTTVAGSAPAAQVGQTGQTGQTVLGPGELLRLADMLMDRRVQVSGSFGGWSGPCRGAPPRTRSDWMLFDDQGCLYVTGALPPGITAPPDARAYGKPVRFSATLKRTDRGQPYLVLLEE